MNNEFKKKSMFKTLKYTNVFYSFKQKDTVKQKYAYFAISDKKYKTNLSSSMISINANCCQLESILNIVISKILSSI